MDLVTSQDPCDDNVLMDNLSGGRRHPNTTSSFDSPNLCDYMIDECLYKPQCVLYELIVVSCLLYDYSGL